MEQQETFKFRATHRSGRVEEHWVPGNTLVLDFARQIADVNDPVVKLEPVE